MKQKLVVLVLLFNIYLHAQDTLTHVVYFNTNKFEVPQTEENRLLLFISTLENIDIEKISIYGFCDDRGTNNYNLNLSKKRANAIKTIFSNNEISEDNITNVDGKGEILLKLIKEQDIHKIRGLNRKVEIEVTTLKHPEQPVEIENEEVEKIETPKETKITQQNIVDGTIKKGDKITLDKLYFKTGYRYLTKESKPTLEKLAKILKQHTNIYFTIQGHVCCTQNSRDALDRQTKKRNLSIARAKYIYDYLARKGVNKKRMKYIGMRRKFPLGGDPKYDRRVEILITHVAEKK